MLRVVEQAHRSDTGRQRSANEDALYARAPLFAVADGMGGAQAGEVASRIATEAFEPAERGSSPPEAYLRSIADSANQQIHRLAESDASRSGMGTTLTAALLEGDELSLAHVGDSRAYRWRGGELKLLTSDHSLVEELRRQGRLTDEQAEGHPQRSIITRALGPEPRVEVDTMTYRARPGDVFVLCSDGLTTMVTDERIAAVLRSAADLDTAVSTLVAEANEAGGRDNVTVVAFRVDEEGAPVGVDGATLVGPSAEEAGLTTDAVRTARPPAPRRTRARPRRRTRTALKAGLGLVAVAALVAAAVYGARQVYFLGTDEGGRLALYRGLPYELPLEIELYSEVESSPIQVSALPADRRDEATDHSLRSRDDAASLLDLIEDDAFAAIAAEVERGDEARGGRRPGRGGGAPDRERKRR